MMVQTYVSLARAGLRALAVSAVCGLLTLATSAVAQDPGAADEGTAEIDSEHLFGFTEGADIGVPGEKELESETTGRLGKRGGRFRAFDSSLAIKLPQNETFRIAPGVAFARYDISGVPGYADQSMFSVAGAFVETRLRVLDRRTAPFGLTVSVAPGLSRIEGATGLSAATYGSEFAVLADREIIPGKLVGAINVSYALAHSRLRGTDEVRRGSGTEVSGALAYQLKPGLFVGGEARYVRAYSDLVLGRYAGNAVYLGPTFYTALSSRSWLSFTWSAQVAGRARGVPGGLDLTTFDRHNLRLRVGYSF